MSVPNALLAWPVRFTATSYVVRVTINSVTEDLNFPASGSLTVGRDYWMIDDTQADATPGSTNNGVGSLITLMQDTINSHTQTSTAAVTIGATFLLTIGYGTSLIGRILWDHANTTLDQAVFGFPDSTTASAGFALSTYVPYGLCPIGKPLLIDGRPRQPVTRGIGRSMTGKTRVSNFGLPYKEREINLDFVNQTAALTEYASSPTSSLEYAWVYSMSLGRYFRLYADETSRTSTSYTLNTLADLEDALVRSGQWRIRWKDRINATQTEP